MKDQRPRLVLITLLVLLAAWSVSNPEKFKLGVDLQGGTILIYEASDDSAPSSLDMDDLLPALKERLDPAGLKNYVIRALGNNRVEITMPVAETEDVDSVKRKISTVGQLQFKIVAHRKRHQDLIERAENAWPNKQVGVEGMFIPYGIWVPAQQRAPADQALIAEAEKEWPAKILSGGKFIPTTDLNKAELDESTHIIKVGADGQPYVLVYWNNDDVLVDETENLVKVDDQSDRYALMYNDVYNVTGEYLTRVDATMQDLKPAVAFSFNGQGAARFSKLTGEYRPDDDGTQYQLGVILDNRLRSAPNLRDRISKDGVISGNFTNEEVKELVEILNAGKLPFALKKKPSSTFQIGPALGLDTILKGAWSIGISLAAVIVFIAIYYRFAGLVANLALFLCLLFTVSLMVMFKATWTLPGLAGLVLTVGMSVDANVLIFERIREEMDHGATLGMAIRNGYEKAFSTIVDSNLTTVLTAIILFMIGTEQVKGFAVTLIMGIMTSMFCALFVTRTVFNLAYDRRWLRKLGMMRLLATPSFDFLKTPKLCAALSIVIIFVGLVALSMRGKENFDIDFTGGTMVGLRLNKPLTTAKVRELADANLPDVSVEKVGIEGDPEDQHYVVRTTERDATNDEPSAASGETRSDAGDGATVSQKIARAFEGYLVVPKMTPNQPEPITRELIDAAKADEEKPKTGAETTDLKPLEAFLEGQYARIEFDKPRSPTLVRDFVNDILATQDKTGINPADLYALIPQGEKIEESDGAAEEFGYREFILGTNVDLPGLLTSLDQRLTESPDFDQFNQFGPQVAGETQTRAIWAIGLSWLAIIAYVWFRFGSWAFGLAGVVALIHDVLVATGVMALVSALASRFPALDALLLTDMKINLNTVAALLTLIGYSINDTIVIFDRIREVRGKSPQLTNEMVNRSINSTLSRTIITSVTTFFVVFILFAGGGPSLHGFAFILVIGIITGTYSTIFVASPVLLALHRYQMRNRELAKGKPGSSASAAAL